MPADFLSRNVVTAVEIDAVQNCFQSFPALRLSFDQLAQAQAAHPPFADLRRLMAQQELPELQPHGDQQQQFVYRQQLTQLSKECFIKRGVLWRRTELDGGVPRHSFWFPQDSDHKSWPKHMAPSSQDMTGNTKPS